MHTRAPAEPGWEGKPGLFPCPRSGLTSECFAHTGWKSPLLKDPMGFFRRHSSKHISNVATPKIIPALQGELKVNGGGLKHFR